MTGCVPSMVTAAGIVEITDNDAPFREAVGEAIETNCHIDSSTAKESKWT